MAIPIKKNSDKKKKTNTVKDDTSFFDFLNKDIKLLGSSLNDNKKEQIYTSLHALLKAAIPISKAFETLIAEMEKKKDKEILQTIYDLIVSGSSLSKAMEESGYFSTYEFLSIQIGEETGSLNKILKELQLYFNQKVDQRRKLIGAMSYPFVVISVAIVVVVFMLQVVVPLFADIFKRFGGDLPWITQTVLNFSDFVKGNFLILLIILFGLIFLGVLFRKNQKFQIVKDNLLLKIPIVNQLVLKIYLSRYCKSMALLTAAKIPVTESLDMLNKMISFHPISKGTDVVKQAVLKGKPIHQGFSEAKIFPNKLVALVKIGEEVNKLEEMFNQLADQYRSETEYRLQIFNSMLEPFLIIFLALIIGIILVAMYLPIFQLSTQMI